MWVCVCVCVCVFVCVCECVCASNHQVSTVQLDKYSPTQGNKKCECFDNINAVFIWIVLEIRTMPSNHRIVTIELHSFIFLYF